MAWKPILSDRDREKAVRTIRDVADELIRTADILGTSKSNTPRLGLANGEAGIALLFSYLARSFPESRYKETADWWKARLVACASALPLEWNFFGGVAGLGWVLSHVQQFDDSHFDLSALDHGVLQIVRRDPWIDHHDLVLGLVGYGVYALERQDPIRHEIVNQVLAQLQATSVAHNGGRAWYTRADLLPAAVGGGQQAGRFDLGMAHGIAGVIAFLAKVVRDDDAHQDAGLLLNEAVTFLLKQRLDNGFPSYFPSFVVPGQPSRPARTAWCYGDAGVGVALVHAGQAAQTPTWVEEGIRVLASAAARTYDAAGVRDASFCHGTAGLAHIYNRIGQTIGDIELIEASQRWYRRTLDMRQGSTLAGFDYMTRGPEQWHRMRSGGMLTGLAGVALSLLAAVSDVPPEWDRVFLIGRLEPI